MQKTNPDYSPYHYCVKIDDLILEVGCNGNLYRKDDPTDNYHYEEAYFVYNDAEN